MTGHGQSLTRLPGYSIDVEVRTVNNRFLKVSTKLSDLALPIEPEIEGLVRDVLKRGSVSIAVRVVATGDGDSMTRVNQPILQSYLREARKAAEIVGVNFDGNVGPFLSLPGVLQVTLDDENPALEEAIRSTCTAALVDLQKMRSQEGDAMATKFADYLDTIRALRHTIESRAPMVVADYRGRLEQRVKSILEEKGLEQSQLDLVREVALYCDRTDISEEITRLGSHLDQFTTAIQSSESQGRRLDFLVQEMGRETNTIGSKANDAEISHCVVSIKTLLEQIRELVQNVE